MAKGGKKSKGAPKESISPAPRSYSGAAFDALMAGDAVTARRLANELGAGKAGPDEANGVKKVAKELSAEAVQVAETPQAVAQELLARTRPPPKAYLLGGVAAAVYLLLLTLATVRY